MVVGVCRWVQGVIPEGLFKNIYLFIFIYLWLCWVFLAVCRRSPGAESRGSSLVLVSGLLIAVASLVAEHGL